MTMRNENSAADTTEQFAHTAGLDKRYVREWLGGVVAGCIVEFDPATQTYALPLHHAAVLTRAAAPNNLARVAQFIALLAEVEQKVIGCFSNGGGLPYSEYPRFHGLMAEQSAEVFDAALVDAVLPLADGLVERLAAGVDVADIGMAETYDVITAFDAIHDQAQPARVLENIFRALRPGGVFLMVDIKASSNVEDNVGVPFASYFYTVSTMHCISVSLAMDGDGLGTCWGRQLATTMLADAGFADVTVREIETDPVNYYYVARK